MDCYSTFYGVYVRDISAFKPIRITEQWIGHLLFTFFVVDDGYPGYPWDIQDFSFYCATLGPMDIIFVKFFFLHMFSLFSGGLKWISPWQWISMILNVLWLCLNPGSNPGWHKRVQLHHTLTRANMGEIGALHHWIWDMIKIPFLKVFSFTTLTKCTQKINFSKSSLF